MPNSALTSSRFEQKNSGILIKPLVFPFKGKEGKKQTLRSTFPETLSKDLSFPGQAGREFMLQTMGFMEKGEKGEVNHHFCSV